MNVNRAIRLRKARDYLTLAAAIIGEGDDQQAAEMLARAADALDQAIESHLDC